jgi:hypothetical protein
MSTARVRFDAEEAPLPGDGRKRPVLRWFVGVVGNGGGGDEMVASDSGNPRQKEGHQNGATAESGFERPRRREMVACTSRAPPRNRTAMERRCAPPEQLGEIEREWVGGTRV